MARLRLGFNPVLTAYFGLTLGAVVISLVFGFLFPLIFLAVPLFAMPVLLVCYFVSLRSNLHFPVSQSSPEGESLFASNIIELKSRRGVTMKRLDRKRNLSEKIKWRSAQEQIDQITSTDLLAVVDLLPSEGTVMQHFSPEDNSRWIYRFQFKSLVAEFNATGTGKSPNQAFAEARIVLLQQVQEWHEVREKGQFYIGQENSGELAKSAEKKIKTSNDIQAAPTVLIVEDDADIAGTTESIFNKLGCKTIISNGKDGASHKMSFQNIDFIVLDWVLGEDLGADQLVKYASRIIESFRDLHHYFKRQKAKIITYSVLDRQKIQLPETEYFQHLDHWQKPIDYRELNTRAAKLLSANGF